MSDEGDRWRLVNELFHLAVERDAEGREALLDVRCSSDAPLRHEVEALLAADADASEFLEASACSIADPYVGALFKGRYTVERELGRGGVGVVYLASDTALLDRRVVVKVLDEGADRRQWSERMRRKFRHEMEALARIDHPGVVGVLDAGETPDGRPFLVMQFVDGATLRSIVTDGGIELTHAAQIVRQIGDALDAAHDKGVHHRDLKPENVMIQRLGSGDPHVKVVDFGIAGIENSAVSSETTGVVLGTVAYMAPEQLRAAPSSPSMDVFATGVIAYELVTGRVPFRANSVAELADLQRVGAFALPSDLRPDLPRSAERAILKALAFAPAARFARVLDFADAFTRALGSGSPAAPSDRAADAATFTHPTAPRLEANALEAVGGAVPLDSRFYVVREADDRLRTAVARRDCIVLIKGARQMGKTSLLARGLQRARDAGARVVGTDFQSLNVSALASLEALYLALGESLEEQLGLSSSIADAWSLDRSPNRNFERYVRREVLGRSTAPLVWGLDEVDRLFTCSFGGEVFGLFRSWYNARSLDPAGPFRDITLVIAYATEAHLFITDLNQSPFNVGTRLELDDFTLEEVAELNRRHGEPVGTRAELEKVYDLFGGHPYLVRIGLYEMASREMSIDDFERVTERENGPFADHLRRILVGLEREPALADAVRDALAGRPCASAESFYRLRSAGVMKGDVASEIRPRCRLYERYLRTHLG